MFPSDELENLMRYGVSQELCDEIDAAFRLTERQAGQIEQLRQEVQEYRKMMGLFTDR